MDAEAEVKYWEAEGRKAHSAGKPKTENPCMRPDTGDHTDQRWRKFHAWDRGWEESRKARSPDVP